MISWAGDEHEEVKKFIKFWLESTKKNGSNLKILDPVLIQDMA